MKSNRRKKNFDLFDKNPDNWRGPFYYNPQDLRLFVPKRHPSMGLTLNFGNRNTYLILIGILLIIFLLTFI